ncbi:hypothetical protein M3Y99_01599500 [Aphelenchoides fujianensis]|nr:hypothetical protein M3Y99_01599500 [Aphelenchoides fujianensis]
MVIMERRHPTFEDFDRRRQEHAAVLIQSIIRRFLAVRLLERMKSERQSLRRKEQAAITIQNQVRRFLAVRLAKQLRYERELIHQLKENHAALVIQRFYRLQRQKKFERAAVVLQSHIRRFLTQRMVERMKAECCGPESPKERNERHCEEERAAIVIQSRIRKFLATKRVERMREQQEAIRQLRERHAAIVIQRFYRTHRHDKFEHAAVVLQSNVRRFLAFRRYQRMKSSKKSFEQHSNVAPVNPRDAQTEDRLDGVSDRLMAETRAAAEHADSVGPLGKAGSRQVDDATAALIIQRSWRGFLTRREQAELVKRLKKMRANVRSSPINPKEHRNLPFPFHVAQCHRQFGPKTKSSLLAALKTADEAIRVADALPEH